MGWGTRGTAEVADVLALGQVRAVGHVSESGEAGIAEVGVPGNVERAGQRRRIVAR